MPLISFGSDNHAGVHPQILKSLVECNDGFAPSYEMDEASQALKKYLKNQFQCADAFLVFNGTAANVLSLSCAIKSFESVLCTDISHLNVDECGAPEKFTGAKLIPIPHQNGKVTVPALKEKMIRRGDQHFSQVKMVSITQPTEFGTVYSFEELRQIREFCDQEKLYLHIDGARLGNAAYFLNCGFKDLLAFSDVTSLGGTKNGLLFGELVIIQNKTLAENFKFSRKQAMQLPSKTKFMAAQFKTYFENNVWREIAEHQCVLAQLLKNEIEKLDIRANYSVDSNAVFCHLSKEWIKPLREEFFFYVWDEVSYECRLMTSFNTKREDIQSFIDKITNLKR